MEQSFIEKRIASKATERVDKDYREFIDFCNKNPFAKQIQIKVNNINIFLTGNNYNNQELFSPHNTNNKNNDFTNYIDIFNKLQKKYEKEETEILLDKLDSVKYLFDNLNNI
jgi:hypothetical protein